MIDLQQYLDLTPMMIIATKDQDWNPYTANVYFKCDQNKNFYFRSKIYRQHSQHIINSWQVARSIINTIRFNKEDPAKKWLQFQWSAYILEWDAFNKASDMIYHKWERYNELTQSSSHIFKCIPTRVKIRDEEKFWWDWKVYQF